MKRTPKQVALWGCAVMTRYQKEIILFWLKIKCDTVQLLGAPAYLDGVNLHG